MKNKEIVALQNAMNELHFECERLAAENKALHEENKNLIEYITNIGVKIKTELCTEYNFQDRNSVTFKRLDLDRATLYVKAPDVKRTNEFLNMIRNCRILPPFNFASYQKNLTADLSKFSDSEMLDYKYRRETGV